jgi:hypothetical protein
MKVKIFSLALLIFITASGLSGSAQKRYKKDFNGATKSYSKTYPAGDDKLRIDNEYGDVIVNTWNKNEFKVDVQIKVSTNGGNDQKLLDKISIEDKKSGNGVFFQTKADWGHTSGSQNILINYTVYMPAKNALEISDDYGNIELPEMNGKVSINSSYGSLTAKSLNNSANSIELSYSNSNMGYVKAAKLSGEYGTVSIGTVGDLIAKLDYTGINIGTLQGTGSVNADYGHSINVANLGKDFKKLSITSEYTSVNIGTKDAEDASFDITIENGSFKHDAGNISITSTTPPSTDRGWSPTKNYKGHVGKGDGSKIIAVNAQYGSVRIY